MAKDITAGILPIRVSDTGHYEFFIGHPGGPFHKGDENKWSILKGRFDESDESIFKTALREFYEESGVKMSEDENDYTYLGFVEKTKRNIHVWVTNYPHLDKNKCHSNKFPLQKKDGSVIMVPEIDKYDWVNMETACLFLNKPQDEFIHRFIQSI